MPFHFTAGIKATELEPVAAQIGRLTSSISESRDSSYLGPYELFHLPESVVVKFNFVVEQEEWDYPQHKNYGVLVVAGNTERPEFFRRLIEQLGFQSKVIKERALARKLDSRLRGNDAR